MKKQLYPILTERHLLHQRISLAMCLLMLVVGCRKADDDMVDADEHGAVTIVYLEANNNLRAEAQVSLNQLEQGLFQSGKQGNILAYIKDNSSNGYLLKILPDNDPYKIVSDTIHTFPLTSDLAGQVHSVLSYIKRAYVSREYNLILWSHGTSWAPAVNLNGRPKVKSFGEDRGQQIDIKELRAALPMKFNYIIFDACSMSSIEVIYEFKDITNYIIASPTDVLSDGFPYQTITYEFVSPNKGAPIAIAEKYYQYYSKRSGLLRSATVAVTDVRKISKLPSMFFSYLPNDRQNIRLANVQRMDFSFNFPVQLYDFKSFLRNNMPEEKDRVIRGILDKAIIYKANTPTFIGNEINEFCGITISYPKDDDPYFDYYRTLGWWLDGQ